MAVDGDPYSPPFTDPRNITVGHARVIWAQKTRTLSGDKRTEGWVLPGGRRTTDQEEAWDAAAKMDRILREAPAQ